ncbi:hypothetical protein GCM10022255_004780 [Dactylosporangium darangshiense]|uniref:Uncharacterized protein n=1 Tax=Dactylosporangium darangshiense TaxID=579108 RepID=A0ABP8CVF0_9ACTN
MRRSPSNGKVGQYVKAGSCWADREESAGGLAGVAGVSGTKPTLADRGAGVRTLWTAITVSGSYPQDRCG